MEYPTNLTPETFQDKIQLFMYTLEYFYYL